MIGQERDERCLQSSNLTLQILQIVCYLLQLEDEALAVDDSSLPPSYPRPLLILGSKMDQRALIELPSLHSLTLSLPRRMLLAEQRDLEIERGGLVSSVSPLVGHFPLPVGMTGVACPPPFPLIEAG